MSDVGDWLRHVLMEQYVAVFAQNEISGPILLDVTLEDLDYMSISVLGHRKVLLKGAEELRKHGRLVGGPNSSTSANLSASLNSLGSAARSQSASRLVADDDAQAKQSSSVRASLRLKCLC